MQHVTDRKDKLIEAHRYINVEDNWWEFVENDMCSTLDEFGWVVRGNGGTARRRPWIQFKDNYGWSASAAAHPHSLYDLVAAYRAMPATPEPVDRSLRTVLRDFAHSAEHLVNLMTIAGHGDVANDVYIELTHAAFRGVRQRYDFSYPHHAADVVVVRLFEDFEATVEQFAEDVGDAMASHLEAEYDALTDDEAVWDTIVANELDHPEEENV
jgi:hypothetical protein